VSISFGGQRQTQAQTNSLDQTTQDYLKQIMDAARASGGAGPSPLLNGAAGYNTGAMNAGNLGFGFLTGDPRAQAALQNPYQSQVVDAMRKAGAVTDQQTINSVNDAATKAGAFGGSRHGVAEGVALGENAQNLNGQIAGLLNNGFTNAQGTAQNLAQMGFNAAGQNANLGFGASARRSSGCYSSCAAGS
jgi:hypothetical protein